MPQQPEPPDRCARCRCYDCGAPLAEHTETGCHCQECTDYPNSACQGYVPHESIAYLAEYLAPLLSAHLNDRAARRCTAVAHAAHHALIDYDYPATPEA